MGESSDNDHAALQAVLIPGGGLSPDGSPAAWVCNRLDRAAAIYKQYGGKLLLILLSAGTTHKAPPQDLAGYPVYEAAAGALYLMQKHQVPSEHIRHDMASLDTIGNAAFARLCFTDPDPALRRLLIITSEFHMPRAQRIFEWVYGLPPVANDYRLSFETVPDIGLQPEDLRVRMDKEEQGLASLMERSRELTTLPAFQRWLFTQHDAYSAKGLTIERPQLSVKAQHSY